MASPVIQFKRGAFASLPALKAGEPAFTNDKYDLYIGLDNNSSNNKFFGSHRYWLKETATAGSGLNLVEGTNNGVHAFTLKAAASMAASYNVTFPNAQGANTAILQNNGSGVLSWTVGPTFAGPVTISDTTDSTSKDTGALIVEGGVGIEKSVHVGAALSVTDRLYVGGQSEFIGIATFRGGTVRLGDSTSDDIVVGGEFASNLVPTTDDGYDLGSTSQQWRHLFLDGTADVDSVTASGISTFSANVDVNADLDVDGISNLDDVAIAGVCTVTGEFKALSDVELGDAVTDTITATGRFDSDLVPSTDGTRDLGSSTLEWEDLFLDGTANVDTLIADTAKISDLTDNRVVIAGTAGELEDSANLTFDGSTLAVTGALTVSTNATITGNLTVLGTQSILNTETLKVEDSLIEVGLVNSGGSLVAPSSDANIDVGIIMHYYSGSAKKAAVYWDDSVARVVVGSDVSESTSVLTAAAYAALEVGSIWVKDAAGQTETIGHDGSQRILHNITVDGGSF